MLCSVSQSRGSLLYASPSGSSQAPGVFQKLKKQSLGKKKQKDQKQNAETRSWGQRWGLGHFPIPLSKTKKRTTW